MAGTALLIVEMDAGAVTNKAVILYQHVLQLAASGGLFTQDKACLCAIIYEVVSIHCVAGVPYHKSLCAGPIVHRSYVIHDIILIQVVRPAAVGQDIIAGEMMQGIAAYGAVAVFDLQAFLASEKKIVLECDRIEYFDGCIIAVLSVRAVEERIISYGRASEFAFFIFLTYGDAGRAFSRAFRLIP